jgi:hypothetical protein
LWRHLPSAPKVLTAVLWRRRPGRARSGEHRPRTPHPGPAAARTKRLRRLDAPVSRDAASSPKARRHWTRGHRQHVKWAPDKAETRAAACKGVSAVRGRAGGLYDAGTYCYTLVKCLKRFVRNEKGVIEANDYTQGSPINSEPLVMKRTPRNEKRAPKASARRAIFGLLSIYLFPLLFF